MKTKFIKLLMAVLLAVAAFMGVAQTQPGGKQMIKRVEAILCPDRKPIGNASATIGVRVVRVKDFSDAHAYLLRICPQREIKEEKKSGNLYYSYILPEGKGQLVLTDKVTEGKNEVAVLEVNIAELKDVIGQIRFIK